MDPVTWCVLVVSLYALSFLVPVAGVVCAVIRTRSIIKAAEAKLVKRAEIRARQDQELSALDGESDAANDEKNAINLRFAAEFEKHGITPDDFTAFNADPTGEVAVLRALRLVAKDNVANAALIGVGGLCGIAASIMALWPPV